MRKPRWELQKQTDFVPSCLPCCDKDFYFTAMDSFSLGDTASLGVLRLCPGSKEGFRLCSLSARKPRAAPQVFLLKLKLPRFLPSLFHCLRPSAALPREVSGCLCCRGRGEMCTRFLARYAPDMYFFRDHLECLRPDFTDNAILFGTQFWFWEFMDRVLGLTAVGFPLAWEHLKIFFSCNERNFFFPISTH